MMNRQLLRTLRLTRRQWNCSSAANNAIGIHHHYNATRLASPLITNNVIPTTHHMKLISSASFSTDADSKSSAEKVGIVSRIRTFIKTIFGSNDDTPRGVQERKDMYWILLAVTHRKLRMEAQQTQLSSGNNKDQLTWNNESKEEIKQYMEEAVSYLDEQTDISEMPLRRLRQEIQSRLEPQIIQLLNVACDVEEDMILCHNNGAADNQDDDDDDENYDFSDAEATEYREILLQEYDRICKLLANTNASDATQYYKLKKGAIETLLQYFDWMPQSTDEPKPQTDEEDYVDNFGFYPNRSEAEIVSAMRYYHVRNIVRSHRVRTLPTIDTKTGTSMDVNNDGHYTYSILPFKSTISNAGRGVFIDGFAPAGTLLSFFPGKVWPKEHLMTASLQTQMQFSQNDPRNQLSMRYDDILIDSRQSPYTVVKNLWAAGHIMNHPPPPIKSTMSVEEASESNDDQSSKDNDESSNPTYHFQPRQGPNCVTVPINFTEGLFTDQNERLREYIPNEYELPPKSWAKDVFEKEKVVMHGMGLIALRDLKDEELFYDYRMSPNENAKGSLYPSWYYVWDVDAATNRWSTDDE
ncbi:SET domain-containing protein [Skeletonema marinoi]|uniref:SET domain-containing protein n=1 Tax=Skeletonema marinoi TaxID=267567 RepID=A0AAD9D9B7_9STRA|nr:SET domain-containing protein [Skeletonema marinoi]